MDVRTEIGSAQAPAGNTATGILKLNALFFMLIDHLGAAVFPQIPEMRILGRLAFPIYCWCMTVGFHYTRSVPRYLGRILIVGVISQPLYAYVMNHMGNSGNLMADLFLTRPNIFLTLFLGLAALWGIRAHRYGSQVWGPILALCLATCLRADYGWRGVLFIMLLYMSRRSRPAVAAVMIAFFLFWGTSYTQTRSLFGIPVQLNPPPEWFTGALSRMPEAVSRPMMSIWDGMTAPLQSAMRLEAYGLLAMPLILIPFPKDVRMPRWVGYMLYPAHLVVVQIVKIIVRALAA